MNLRNAAICALLDENLKLERNHYYLLITNKKRYLGYRLGHSCPNPNEYQRDDDDDDDLCGDVDPHATLPFISHHTLNLTRDLERKSAGWF